MGAVDWAALGFIGKPEYVSAAKDYGIVPGSGIDYTAKMAKIRTDLAGSRKTLVFDGAGEVLHSDVWTINAFYVECSDSVIVSNLLKAGARVALVAAAGIEGGVWKHKYTQPVTITAASVSGNVATITCPGHQFIVGDSINCHLLVGLGGINDTSKTITGVNGDDVTFAHTNADASATIPFERDDLYNTGPNALYPFIKLSRTQASADAIIYAGTSAVGWHVRDVEMGPGRGGFMIEGGSYGHVHNTYVHDTGADGVHLTNGAHHLRFTGRNKVERTGDTAWAIVSYRKNGGIVHDIEAETIDVANVLYHGNGLDLVGGERITIERYIAENIYGAAINLVQESQSYYVYGLHKARIGHATVRTCGAAGTQPAGWDDVVHGVVSIEAQNQLPGTPQRGVVDLEIGRLEAYNSRYRVINTAGPAKGMDIGTLVIEGCNGVGLNLSSINGWRIGKIKIAETKDQAISTGGSGVVGTNVLGEVDLYNINNGSPIELVSGGCDGTTVSYVTKAAHGMTGTPSFRVLGMRSNFTDGASSSNAVTQQDKDYALNGNFMLVPATWAGSTNYALNATVIPTTPNGFYYKAIADAGSSGGSEPTWPITPRATVVDGGITWMALSLAAITTYSGIAFPDTTTIELTGTGLAASVSPSVYSIRETTPQARIYKGGTASNDGMLVSAGAAPMVLEVGRFWLNEQFLPLERLIDDASQGSCRVFDGRDLTGALTSSVLSNLINDAGELGLSPSFQRYHTGPYTGVPAGAVVAANTLYLVPVFIARGMPIVRLGFRVSTLETGADARMGIYALNNDLIVAAPEQVNAFDAAGDKEIAIYQYLPRGWYYLGMVTNATGTGQILWHTIDAAERVKTFDSASSSQMDLGSPDFRLTMAHTYGALPAALTIARNSATTEPHLWLRQGV